LASFADKISMTISLKNLFLAAMLLAFFSLACKSTTFSGSGGQGKRQSADGKKDAPDGDTDTPDAGDGPDSDGDSDSDGGPDSGEVDTGTDKDAGGVDSDADQANGGNLGETNDCLAAKADSYNIMMIFDRSRSQLDTDPAFVRRDGALAFVDRVYSYIQTNPKARVYMSTLAFNEASVRGANGWQRLKDTSIDVIKSDITTATSNPDGGTAYSPVLKDAANFFEQINSQTNPSRTRNYVVFLTDGLPNALASGFGGFPGGFGGGGSDVETAADIPVAVDNLVKNFGVAMIAIASGPGIPPEGESVVQGLAQPTTGIKDKNHVGIYRRAQTPEDLKQVFDKLLSDIGTCN
jgi:hypothetical protein